MPKIVQKDDPVLHRHAREVPPADIMTPEIQRVIDDMRKALAAEEDGVAIAAPQIGVSLRIFVVSKHALEIEAEIAKRGARGEGAPAIKKSALHDLVFINPEFTRLSKKQKWVPEGCLSVRWLYGKVLRADKATVRAYDEKGKPFTRGGSGLMAQIFQHETDHLSGTLFIEKARDIEEIPPEYLKKARI